MTKTLTEQWRKGTLPAGMYYIKADGVVTEAKLSRYNYFYNLPHGNGHEANKKVEEVLAPVPSYDEWKQAKENLDKNGTWYTERSYKRIEKQLEIATKALEEYDNRLNWDIRGVSFMKYNKGFTLARKALKEMEGVK